MAQLQQRSKCFALVINVPNDLNTQDEINQFITDLDEGLQRLTLTNGWYASIWHTETNKTLHCHVVIRWDITISAGRFLKLLVWNLSIPIECISIEIAYSIVGAVQYLTHKNYANKYQYSYDLINTNNASVLSAYYNDELPRSYSMQELYDLCCDFGFRKRDIMIFLGIENWNRYRLIINDFIQSFRKF